MALHEKDKIKDSINDDVYASSNLSVVMPKYKFPEKEHDPRHAYQVVHDELMPAGLPSPAEDKEVIKKLVATLSDPKETYGGGSTYFQTISDLTNKPYRFKSLIAPSDVFFDFDGYNFTEGQPVRLIKRIDRYAQQGWSGDVIPHLVAITGDIYDQAIE